MIVDDSPQDVQLLLRTFRQLGIENRVEVCTGGKEAINFLEASRDNLPALVLLDLKMPAVDGFQVLRKIKWSAELRDIPVIVLTTSAHLMDIQLAYELGANSFLTKPLDLTEFREMVSAFHKYWIVHNKPAPKAGRWIPPPADLPTIEAASSVQQRR